VEQQRDRSRNLRELSRLLVEEPTMIDWKIKEHATGLNHHVRTKINPDTAVTFCSRSLSIQWDRMTEMPPSAVITCLVCLATEARYR
jgi:hypothetical protein